MNIFLLSLLASCSPTPGPKAEAAAPAPATTAPAGARSLASGATFGDLVRSFRDDPTAHPGRNCLLSAAGPLIVETPVTLGRPTIPDPPADLDAALALGHGAPRLWASWGDTEGGDLLDLVALTPVSKAVRNTTTGVLLVTDKGTYLRVLGIGAGGEPMAETDIARLKRDIVPRAQAWVITAEAGVALESLRTPLAWIRDTKGTVVLATASLVPLGPTRRISRYDDKVAAGEPSACDLAQMQKPGNPSGEFGQAQYRSVAAAFDAISASCGAGLAPGEGGAIHVLTRISAKGSIDAACAETDDTQTPAIRACVMKAVQAMTVEPPATPGTVNFGTALLFFGTPIGGLCL